MSEHDRYTTDQMTQIWSGDWKMRRWAEIETAAATALGAPSEALEDMSRAPVPSAQSVADEEARTRHDVIAFLNLWRAGMGEQGRAWSHRGLTSSDVVDTANALRMKASTDALRATLRQLTLTVGRQALMYRDAVRVGRTHGQHAEVTTWGWRLAGFAYDLMRAEQRFSLLAPVYEVGKLSGPIGDYKTLRPEIEHRALADLGLSSPGVCTQVVPRDVYVDYLHCLAQTASVVENVALEVRLSSRSEVAEVREGTLSSQRGSSAMPHKRNPITAEKLCGLARVVRAQVDQVAQGVALHHERDIAHSSVERLALATASQVTDYMLSTCNRMMADLRVYPDRMRANVVGNLDLLSSLIKDRLIRDYGVDPQEAYELVFWAFREWDRPEQEREYKTLADALLAVWVEMDWKSKRSTDAEYPDFKVLVRLLDEPEKLVGSTEIVFTELDYLLNPEKRHPGPEPLDL
jgi:adenylosuccinate lyase